MTAYAALLRAVNVGGTGRLPMADLRAMCDAAGFANPRTLLASGNAMFESGLDEAGVKAALGERLAAYAGKPVGVLVRTAAEMAAVLAADPFPGEDGARTLAIFLDAPPPPDAAEQARHRADERIALGQREIYVAYGSGMRDSRLAIPAARTGTSRNMNTVRRIAEALGC